MLIEYLAHSSFFLRSKAGVTIIIDPYDPRIGYGPINRSCDLIITSHDHRGHNFISAIQGRAQVLQCSLSPRVIGATKVRNVLADHDDSGGERLGKTMVALIEMDGIRCCHLGDIGHVLNDEQIGGIGQVDLLLIPVGGHSTVDAKRAHLIVGQLSPRLVIPMHYLTGHLNREEFPLLGVDSFLEEKTNVSRSHESVIELNPDTLPKNREILVLGFTN